MAKKDTKLLDELINNRKEELYYKTNILNFKELRKHEEDLINSGEYVPNLIRGFISLDYYSRCDELGVMETVMQTMAETRKQGREADVIEAINWVDNHKKYSSILNEGNIKKLGDEVEQLEKEYNELLKLL